MNVKFKKALALSSAALISTSLITVNAATLTKTLKAEYNNIKVTYDGKLQSPNLEPFMVNGSVYVGLRDAGQMTNNNVSWDSANKTVHITSKGDSSATSEELAKKNLEIASLNNKVDDLEDKIEELEAQLEDKKEEEDKFSDIDDDAIDDLLDDLDDDYDKEYSVGWVFDLKFNEKDEQFELEVSYESDDDGDDFNKISNATFQKFLTKICEDIQSEFGAFPIEGELYDYSESYTLIEFTFDEDEEFDMTRSYPLYIVEEFEETLKDDYSDLVSEGAPSSLTGLDIDSILIEENEDNYEELTFHIYTNLESGEADEWNTLIKDSRYERTIESNLRSLTRALSSFFNTDEIDGYILAADNERLASFEDNDIDFDEYKPN